MIVLDDGRLAVYEDESVRAAVGKSDEEFMASCTTRNRFGTGRMLKVMREVKRLYPHARSWRRI